MRAIEFFPAVLRHSKGQYAGTPFELMSWQQFVVGSIFGWKLGGIRRFRTAFVSTARKNGKSTIEAGIGLKALVDEQEPGAEIYAAATTREQSRIVFSEAERMRAASPALRRRIVSTTNNLSVIDTASWFRPLSADASKMDGLNVFVALVDELHEHPSAEVIEKLDTGMGARLEPLMYETTTAGVNRHSICFQHWEFSIKVLEETVPFEVADRWFAFIATVDDDDDWQDERAWHKANPSLGHLLKIEDLRAEVALARQMPGKQNSIRRLRLNQWTQQLTRWLDMDLWARGSDAIDVAALRGRRCYGGLDLARVNDLSSLALLFPPVDPGERWQILWFHWCPEDDIVERARRDRAPYLVWRDLGHLVATEGNTTDFKFIEHRILELARIYDIADLAFDRTFAGEIIRNLTDENVNCVEFGQGFFSMGPPTAEFMRKLLAGELQHGGDPIATWCASNVTVRTDPAGNQKPDKERSIERIDPIVAAIMAVGRSLAGAEESPYADGRGLLVL
jgi:phage terminase large subunit-like protein